MYTMRCLGLVDNNHLNKMADLTDIQLASLVSSNDSNAFVELAARYLSLVKAKMSHFRSPMLETDDLCQEGLMGLLNAAHTYDSAGGASFRTYAGVCISNRMIMACRRAASQKNLPLNNFVSLSDDEAAMDMQDHTTNPETMLIDNENLKLIRQDIEQTLSLLEQRVLMLYLGGCSYNEISAKLGITFKAADNALQRVRFKLKKLFK
jgi:RNA polymerase sporulation-specific sigma factor